MKFTYDVIVIGAGHAGCEAAAASANMGAKTCLITIDMNKIGQMSCNPAIGGIAKGQIVREIDALGGFTGIVTDRSSIQFRMLNSSKGPAMWSPRAQCDRGKFIWNWREVLDSIPNLSIYQDMVKELIFNQNEVVGLRTWWGVELYSKAIIVTTGTFLNGLMHIGRNMLPGGRCAEPASTMLTESIASKGIVYGRMKTGTPVRIDRKSVHFEDMEKQECEETTEQFSYLEKRAKLPQIPCWITHTNKECHDVLRSGFADSPLYNGQIKSIGPRYCPSIETKLTTFADKDSHHLFLEPEGSNTDEMYLNGFSSSLPIDIQINALKKIPAFRNVKIYRPGYAIEYDYFDPTQLKHTLESKIIDGLFFAGQVNGTTGYEEAAGQGVIAGINAALKCVGNKEFTLNRDDAYIGVLIDDLVLKGVDEPYRMFTSRAEYRILLRQDNADERLTEKSYNIGLASKERYDSFINKHNEIAQINDICKNIKIKKEHVISLYNIDPLETCSIERLIKRTDINFPFIDFMSNSTHYNFSRDALNSVYVSIKYNDYIDKEKKTAEKMKKTNNISIPSDFDYDSIKQLTIEARQKLNKHKPRNIGDASRIPGISPSDINVLIVALHH